MVPVLHSSPVNPDGQMHWKLSSSRKFGLHVEFFTHGELVQGFCIRRKKKSILSSKNTAGCLLRIFTQDEKSASFSMSFFAIFLHFSTDIYTVSKVEISANGRVVHMLEEDK